MSRITQKSAVAPLDLFKQATSVVAGAGQVDPGLNTAVGQRFDLEDGREVVLVSNGAVALVSGVLVQSSAIVANHQNLTVAVTTVPATAGTFQISATLGATKLDTAQYVGGYAIVNAGTGKGQTLAIANHPNSAASTAVTFTLEDPIQVTLDATSRISLIANPFSNVVINPTTATATPVGVTFYPVSAATAPTFDGTSGLQTAPGVQQYALLVSKGVTSALSDASVAGVGLGIIPSTTTAGAITVATATGANIGRAFQTSVSAENRAIYIDL